MSLNFDYANASNLDIVYHQIKEVNDPIRPFVRCVCLRKLSLDQAYRCYYCGIWFCEKCAGQHFGKTREQYNKDKAE